MVVARSYQILLAKIDFWPFSHWNSHWSPKNLRTAEGMVVERKQKLFWNQWTKWNILKPCRSWRNQIFWIRITLPTYANMKHTRMAKWFLISIKFRGSSSHFRFDHFYSVDFHSALTSQVSVWKSEGWLKIYNVKMVKIEMVRGTSKLNRNQKSFWLLSN